MSNELTNILFDVMGVGVYRGVYVEKIIGGYRCCGEIVTTKEQLDELINSKMIEWGKTIAK